MAEWSNRATPEQLTAFVVDITRGLMEADDQALDAYQAELEKQGVSSVHSANTSGDRYWQHWWPTLKHGVGRKPHQCSSFIGHRYDRHPAC